jgi:L-ascorbate metabolism protein UlaG (beta-lactamase superfamily)
MNSPTVQELPGGPGPDYLTRAAGSSEQPRFWWLGQAGFAIEHTGRRLLIDPYLSDTLAVKYAGTVFPHTRLHPVPVDPRDVRDVMAVLHTHAHTDHMDPETIRSLQSMNRPFFFAPRARAKVALDRHIPEELLMPVTSGSSVGLDGGVTVTAVPAAHEELEFDANGDSVFLGYIVEIAGVRIYHSGDCTPYDGQAELLRSHHVDVALLPINGRDEYRKQNGVPGNFTVREAAALCQEANIPVLVGHHFGLFDFNTVGREDASRELGEVAGELQWTLPEVGRCYQINAPQPTTNLQ